jgi:uncharacterized protein
MERGSGPSGQLGKLGMGMDLVLAIAGFGVGAVVGMTGMGGGALMTPVLVLFFGIPPLAAVSSDLVVSAVMKPVGAAVHLRRGTVHRAMVGWLCVGSVPSAFAGVLIARALGDGARTQQVIKVALGVALLLAAVGLIVKSYLALVDRSRRRARRAAGMPDVAQPAGPAPILIRPLPTVLVGVAGGAVVGLTSVGSGSLIIIALLALYPTLKSNELVGTDLVQAVPLVLSAAVAHLLFGDFRLDLTVAVLAGAIPGVFVGAQMSSRLPEGLVRRCLALILLLSGLKLLGLSNLAMLGVVGAIVVVGPVLWAWARRSNGLPAFARDEPGSGAGSAEEPAELINRSVSD